MTAGRPASLWVASAAFANPLLGMVLVSVWTNSPPPPSVLGFAGFMLAVAAGLLAPRGWASPAWWAGALVAVVMSCCGLAILTATLPHAPPGRAELVSGSVFLGVGVVQGLALWWPTTRRWCKGLPPAEPEDVE